MRKRITKLVSSSTIQKNMHERNKTNVVSNPTYHKVKTLNRPDINLQDIATIKEYCKAMGYECVIESNLTVDNTELVSHCRNKGYMSVKVTGDNISNTAPVTKTERFIIINGDQKGYIQSFEKKERYQSKDNWYLIVKENGKKFKLILDKKRSKIKTIKRLSIFWKEGSSYRKEIIDQRALNIAIFANKLVNQLVNA